MSTLMVPEMGETDWPTLGGDVARWMGEWLIHGPGDIRGRPYGLDPEKLAITYRAYEIVPLPETAAKRKAALKGWSRETSPYGRRRFKRVGLSVRKGWAKTEYGAAICAAELHPDAPVRCGGWTLERGAYVPVGVGVQDPYIPMVAYTEEQSEELAYGALYVMLSEGPLAEDFDVGLDRILVLGEDGKACGKAVPLATAPDSRDGARTTHQLFDETHRLVLPRAREAHQTMLANIPKRKIADAWSLEVTTSYKPGELSVAEGTHEYAKLVDEGEIDDSRLFYFHRQAGPEHQLVFPKRHEREGQPDVAGLRAAVIEASGPAASWIDVDGIVELYLDPQTDRTYWERVWLNRVVTGSDQLFPLDLWAGLTDDEHLGWRPDKGAPIVLGFDGSQTNDSTALWGTCLETARQFRVGLWERPDGALDWRVPTDEVDQAVDEAYARWHIPRAYADPYFWETFVSAWEGRHATHRGSTKSRRARVVVEWHTNRHKAMALSLKAYLGAIRAGEVCHDGDEALGRHMGNARKYAVPFYDEDGEQLVLMRKERPDSPFKIDAAMAACLSWEAYRDAVAAGGARRRSRVPVSL